MSTRRDFIKSVGTSAVLAPAAAPFGVAAEAKSANQWRKDKLGGMARNVELIAYHDFPEDHAGYQMAMQEVNGKLYLYSAHWWVQGISIFEVTEPSSPRFIKFVPEPSGKKGISMVKLQLADGIGITHMQPKKVDMFFGRMPPETEYDEGVLIWDFHDPENPRVLSRWHTGASGTHRNFYGGGRYVHLSAACPGYLGNIYRILDISDPSKPVEAGRWFHPSQFIDAEPPSTQPPPVFPQWAQHGPPYVKGDKVYISYGVGTVILDISDIAEPKYLGTLQYHPPFGGGAGGAPAHSTVALSQRPLILVTSEGERPWVLDPDATGPEGKNFGQGIGQPANLIGIGDVSDPRNPKLLAIFPKPQPAPGSLWGDSYSLLNGINYPFGPHNLHEPGGRQVLEDRNDRTYCAYFQAGLRVYDITNQFEPKEIAAYELPPLKKWNWQRHGGWKGPMVATAEDIVVDRRGYIYMTTGQGGLYIFRVTV